MATLTPTERAELRRDVVRGDSPIDFDKGTINAALQAVEDWFEGERATVSAAIDAATSPYVFSNARKKKLVRFYLKLKFRKEA